MSFKTKLNLLTDGAFLPVNCRICGGELIPALSPSALLGSVPDDILLAGHSEGAGNFYLCTRSHFYTSRTGGDFMRIADLAGSSPFITEDTDEGTVRAVAVNGVNAVVNSGLTNRAIFSYGAHLRCGVMHCGRLFGADMSDGYKLRWSGEGGLCDWTEGINGSGYAMLDPKRGEVLDILEFGEKLIAVREYGLTVLSMYGAPENFSVKITDTDTDKIFKGTARVAGGKLIFFTLSGLHSYNGAEIKHLPHRYALDITDPVCSAVSGGKYYLSCKSKSMNGGAVLCYDTEDGESYLINIAADGMCSADKIYAYNSAGAFRLEEGSGYSLVSGKVNFGSARTKTVTDIFINGEADLEISNGRVARKFKGVKGHIRPSLRGESFTFKISGKKPIRSVTATAEECNAF